MNIDPQQLHTYLKDAKQSGVREERERIIELMQNRLSTIRKMDTNSNLTAMQIHVSRECAVAVTEALLWAVREQK